jgi:radical SAM protein with 4Fe4S-binding SPASM domain
LLRFLTGGQNGFNLLNSSTGGNGRGISCSLQSSFAIRAADLTIPPCHRLSYDNFNTAYMEEEDGKLTGKLVPLNAEFAISMKTYNYKDSPFCDTCDIQESCIGGCLGSQYETMKDPLLPIPTVCVLEHAKVKAIVEGWINLNVFEEMVSSGRLTKQQVKEHMEIYNEIIKKRERGDV